MAVALKLIPPEEEAFCAAAAGRALHALPTAETNDDMGHTKEVFAAVYAPAYLIDPFYRLYAVNGAALAFQRPADQKAQPLYHPDMGANALSLFFSLDPLLFTQAEKQWARLATSILLHFRSAVLPYRYSPIFDKLMKHMAADPAFSLLWKRLRSQPPRWSSVPEKFEYQHPHWGDICYTTLTVPCPMTSKPLYMIAYLACDERTDMLFADLRREDNDIRWF